MSASHVNGPTGVVRTDEANSYDASCRRSGRRPNRSCHWCIPSPLTVRRCELPRVKADLRRGLRGSGHPPAAASSAVVRGEARSGPRRRAAGAGQGRPRHRVGRRAEAGRRAISFSFGSGDALGDGGLGGRALPSMTGQSCGRGPRCACDPGSAGGARRGTHERGRRATPAQTLEPAALRHVPDLGHLAHRPPRGP